MNRTIRIRARGGAASTARMRSDRKSTRLNSSHLVISYAVFCLKKKIEIIERSTVDFLAKRNDFLDALAQVFPSARHRLFHALEKAGLLFFVQAAKKSLNHRERQ